MRRIDPYARKLEGPLRWTDALFGYRMNSPRADLSFDRRNSAPGMPKCKVVDSSFTWGDDRPPRSRRRARQWRAQAEGCGGGSA